MTNIHEYKEPWRITKNENGDYFLTDSYAEHIVERMFSFDPPKRPEKILEEDGFSPALAVHILDNDFFLSKASVCIKCDGFFRSEECREDVFSDGSACFDCEYHYYCNERPGALNIIAGEWLEGTGGRKKDKLRALRYYESSAESHEVIDEVRIQSSLMASRLNKELGLPKADYYAEHAKTLKVLSEVR